MATNSAPPTDQRAGVRPIAFVLQNGGSFGSPVTLKIRPEDLTRTEPSRVSVHQTLGRSMSGWVDNFGEGLPSLSISGHTGWRQSGTSGMDGVAAFEQLNNLISHEYHKAKQAAIDSGADQSLVKLLFVDMLDNFTWNVVPTSFVLRRSKSRPLLMQYNISLQAVATDIDNPLVILPIGANLPAGLKALNKVVAFLKSVNDKIKGWVSKATSFVHGFVDPIAAKVKQFHDLSTQIFDEVHTAVSTIRNGGIDIANSLIGVAGDIAGVGVNLFRSISAIANLPSQLKSDLSRVASAYNEVVCIFKNSLKPAKEYADYTGLYGASNCSSTTGGRPGSPYSNMNAFNLIQPVSSGVRLSTSASASVSSINNSDPVLAPMPIQDYGRHLPIITGGLLGLEATA